jgi:hypothetical protein
LEIVFNGNDYVERVGFGDSFGLIDIKLCLERSVKYDKTGKNLG